MCVSTQISQIVYTVEFSRGPELALTVIFSDDTRHDKLVWVRTADKVITDTSFISDYVQTAVGKVWEIFCDISAGYQVRFYFYTALPGQ